jgi:D-sedoheptulose 7-phosphate isomerase
LIAISGSGNSRNIINAVNYANNFGAQTLGVIGYDGGELKNIAQSLFLIPSFDMQLCEDIHLMFGHIVMKNLCINDITGKV